MRRVLLVAYYFPPQPKAGALRPSYLAANLKEFGWEPTVLTVDFPGDPGIDCKIVRVKQLGKSAKLDFVAAGEAAANAKRRSGFERALRDAARNVVHFPDDAVGWLWPARTEALRLTAQERYDAVISTAPPPSAHFVGRAVSVSRRIPWIADYRDLWSGPAGPYFDREFGPLKRAYSYAWERWLLRRAASLTAPTMAHRDALAEYFGRPDAMMIPNAADMAAWQGIDAPPPVEFRICYAGKLYAKLRTPDVVFAAVARLRRSNSPAGSAVRFDFFGEDPDLVTESADRHGVRDAVVVHGEVDRRSALTAMRASAVLLLLLNTAGDLDHIEIANPGSKILEYSGAKRPILAVGAAGNAVERIMRDSGLGVFASDEAACASALAALYDDFRAGKLEPVPLPGWRPPTPRDLAGGFASILDRIADG